MHTLTDNALMLKVKSGDLDKMSLIYERNKKRLFGFFYNMNGNASLSEDLVQNVFFRMLKYKHTFTGNGAFAAWMFRTARNVNNDYYRKNKKYSNKKELSHVDYTLKDNDDLNAKMDYDDAVIQLKKALLRLPAEKREILVLSKFKGLKYKEIGLILDCSEGAAKLKAHRALNELRSVFLQMENN